MITIDLKAGIVESRDEDGGFERHALATPEAFDIVSKAWLRCGWDNKHVYSFTWLGRPVIQLPEDLMRIQELIFRIKPDVLVETGVAHGGSLVFYATLFRGVGRGRVVGIDVHIRPPNRAAIEAHPLADLITLIEGDSTSAETVGRAAAHVRPGETAMVVLDSCHTRDHVLAELEAYAPLVGVGSYVMVLDGIMAELTGAPRSRPDWSWNNPQEAVKAFLARHPEFVLEEPDFLFNEGSITRRVTCCPSAFLRRVG